MFSAIIAFIFSIFIQSDIENIPTKKSIPVVFVPEDEIVIENIPVEYMMY
jgi:hypothetical protein